ncbi:hypothetical protein ACFWVP_18970 [Streptomyces sp. NPDC058637]|uniref:hypothetical protein n=1 Tax=Streptomyces sp. NPDC058637 TaxID=3346569 RepID=UPI0036641663
MAEDPQHLGPSPESPPGRRAAYVRPEVPADVTSRRSSASRKSATGRATPGTAGVASGRIGRRWAPGDSAGTAYRKPERGSPTT